MTTSRQKRNGYKGDNSPYYTKKLTSNGAFKFLNDITTLSVEELTAKYGDLSKLEGFIGGDE